MKRTMNAESRHQIPATRKSCSVSVILVVVAAAEVMFVDEPTPANLADVI